MQIRIPYEYGEVRRPKQTFILYLLFCSLNTTFRYVEYLFVLK